MKGIKEAAQATRKWAKDGKTVVIMLIKDTVETCILDSNNPTVNIESDRVIYASAPMSEGQIKAALAGEEWVSPQQRYEKKNVTQVIMKLNKNTDADILEKLDSVPSKQGYIKSLIRNDIQNGEGERDNV